MHDEVARIFVGVERRIKTGKLRTIDTELPHVGSRRPLRVPRHTHAAHTRQRHPTSRAFLHGVLTAGKAILTHKFKFRGSRCSQVPEVDTPLVFCAFFFLRLHWPEQVLVN